jgi:hypothetical protein
MGLGVWYPGALELEKLELALGSMLGKRSLWMPSNMCWSIFKELVAVADCRKKTIVLWKRVCNRWSSTYLWRTGSL